MRGINPDTGEADGLDAADGHPGGDTEGDCGSDENRSGGWPENRFFTIYRGRADHVSSQMAAADRYQKVNKEGSITGMKN